MNRFNFGNQTTNGMQILGVAGTTASGFVKQSRQQKIADASSALNNMSEDEISQVGKYRADRLRDEMSEYYENKNPQSVDDIMGDTPYSNLKSPQADAIKRYVENNFNYYRTYVRDGSRFRKMSTEDFVSRLKKEENNNADV